MLKKTVYFLFLLSSRQPIASAVLLLSLCAHLLFLYLIPVENGVNLSAKQPLQMVVKTIQLKPEKKISRAKKRTPVKKPKKTKQKKPKKKIVKTKKRVKKIEEPIDTKSEELLDNLKQTLSAFKSPEMKKNRKVQKWDLPDKLTELHIENLQSEIQIEAPANGYPNRLANRLKRSLELPEYGKITLQIILHKSGKVLSISVLESESKNNTLYIKEILPRLQFPSFSTAFSSEEEHTFSITLANQL